MPYVLLKDDGEVIVIRLSGLFEKADLDAVQKLGRDRIARGIKPRTLVMLGSFEGWGSGDWGDMAFMSEHGDDIARIAFVGDEKWKDEAFLFVSKGFRKTQVEFFPEPKLAEAEAWVRS